MTLYILKGFHYSTFLPRIYQKKKSFTKTCQVKFDESCRYQIEEQSCVNKLWGFSNGLFGVHKDSWRFGWTYNKEEDKIILWSYIYHRGKLTKKPIYKIDFNEHILQLQLTNLSDKYIIRFIVDGQIVAEYTIDSLVLNSLIELGFYFGGKTRAPHNMNIKFKRIK